MVRVVRQDGPGEDGVPLDMEPVIDKDVPRAGEEVDHGLDWIHVVRDQTSDQ